MIWFCSTFVTWSAKGNIWHEWQQLLCTFTQNGFLWFVFYIHIHVPMTRDIQMLPVLAFSSTFLSTMIWHRSLSNQMTLTQKSTENDGSTRKYAHFFFHMLNVLCKNGKSFSWVFTKIIIKNQANLKHFKHSLVRSRSKWILFLTLKWPKYIGLDPLVSFVIFRRNQPWNAFNHDYDVRIALIRYAICPKTRAVTSNFMWPIPNSSHTHKLAFIHVIQINRLLCERTRIV